MAKYLGIGKIDFDNNFLDQVAEAQMRLAAAEVPGDSSGITSASPQQLRDAALNLIRSYSATPEG